VGKRTKLLMPITFAAQRKLNKNHTKRERNIEKLTERQTDRHWAHFKNNFEYLHLTRWGQHLGLSDCLDPVRDRDRDRDRNRDRDWAGPKGKLWVLKILHVKCENVRCMWGEHRIWHNIKWNLQQWPMQWLWLWMPNVAYTTRIPYISMQTLFLLLLKLIFCLPKTNKNFISQIVLHSSKQIKKYELSVAKGHDKTFRIVLLHKFQ